jgi:hypothetical protein
MIPTDLCDDVPVVHVWVQIDVERFRSFKGQRVMDILDAMTMYCRRKQPSTLCRGPRELMMSDQLRAGEHLKRHPIKYDRVIRGIESIAKGLHTFAPRDAALNWPQSLMRY